MLIRSVAALVACLAASTPAVLAAHASATPTPEAVLNAFDVRTGTTQSLALPPGNAWEPFAVEVALGSAKVTLLLDPNSVRSHDYFQVLEDRGDGKLVRIPDPTPATYAGTVGGAPGARVRASLRDGRLWATIFLPTGEGWTIQPVSELFPGEASSQHLVYRVEDSRQPFNQCGTVEFPAGGVAHAGEMGPASVGHHHDEATHVAPVGASVGASGAGSTATLSGSTLDQPATSEGRGPTVKLCELGVDSDFEFYQANGSNSTNVVNDIENVVNSIEAVYEGESVNTQFEVTTIIVRTVNAAPYNAIPSSGGAGSHSTLLNAFQNLWTTDPNFSASVIKRDVAHLFTGKNIANNNGGIIGVAYLGVLCNSASYFGLSQSRWSANFNNRVSVTTHEIGHNFGGTHCNQAGEVCTGLPTCGVMCASVGGCSGSILVWGACTAGQIASGRDSLGGCMSNLGSPLAAPFTDAFDSLLPGNWVWNYNCTIATPPVALQPAPSASNVLVLNAQTIAGITLLDQIRSNFVNLVGASATTEVSFKWSRNGVPNAATLVVEYWASNLRWTALGTITSDGVNSTGWTFANFLVPANGKHAEFRVRFRIAGSTTTSQNWYIDDVRVGEPVPVDPACNLADITGIGGPPAGPDGQLTVDDLIEFVNQYSASDGCPGAAPCNAADVTGLGGTGAPPDGQLTVDDLIEFVNAYSNGC